MSTTMLDVRGLDAFYGKAQMLFDVTLQVGKGEVVALMGRNGAGKSTTIKSIMGMLQKTRGQVRFMGEDIAGLAPFQIARRGLGFVPEDRRVFSELSVMQNLEVGRQPARSEIPPWTAERLFALFPNLGEMPDRPGGSMSGGEQQMLTVARTLMGNPLLLMLDEPSEGVAPVIVEQMAHMIMQLKQQGLAILLSEQNLHFAQLVCDRAYVLEQGQIRFSGSMQDLAANQEIQQAYLSL